MTAVAENGFFATSFRGFKKEDVLNYIDSLNASHCEELAALQQTVTELQGQVESLTALQQENDTLRAQVAEMETVKTALAEKQGQCDDLSGQLETLKGKLAAAEETASRCVHLQNETAVLKEQLAAQQEQLNTYEKMFGETKSAAEYVQDHVTVRIQNAAKRTDDALSAVEQMTASLTAQLDRLREETAAIRQDARLAEQQDTEALKEWFRQFENTASNDAENHFFR